MNYFKRERPVQNSLGCQDQKTRHRGEAYVREKNCGNCAYLQIE